jgi:hypothetical protein
MPIYNQNDKTKDDEDMNWTAGGGRNTEMFLGKAQETKQAYTYAAPAVSAMTGGGSKSNMSSGAVTNADRDQNDKNKDDIYMDRTAGGGRKSERLLGQVQQPNQGHDAPAESAMAGGGSRPNVHSGVADADNKKNNKDDNDDMNWKVVGGRKSGTPLRKAITKERAHANPKAKETEWGGVQSTINSGTIEVSFMIDPQRQGSLIFV